MFIRLVKKLFKNLMPITKSLQILDNVEKNYCGLLIGRKLVQEVPHIILPIEIKTDEKVNLLFLCS